MLTLRFPPPSSDGCDEGIAHVLAGGYDAPGLNFERPRILDIGAHVGAFSVWAAHRWRGAVIHAYEPHPDSAAFFRKNAGHYAELTEAAVVGWNGADSDGKRAWLYDGTHNTGQRSLYLLDEQREGTGRHVRVMPASQLPPADILKIDTEGCEVEILVDYPHLSNAKAVLLEWHRPSDYASLVYSMPDLGFELVRDDTRGVYAGERNLCFLRRTT